MKFKTWWDHYGSGIRPEKDEDISEFAERIAEIAWKISRSSLIDKIIEEETDD